MYNSNSSAFFFFHYNYNYFIYDLIVIYYNDKLQLQIQFLIDKNFKVKLCPIFFIGYYTLQVKAFVLSCNSWKKTHLQFSSSKELSVVCPKVRAKFGSRKALVKIVGRTLTKEVAAMCSKKYNSILSAKDQDSMLKFKFRTVIIELKNHGTHSSLSPSKLHEDKDSSCKLQLNHSNDCYYDLQASPNAHLYIEFCLWLYTQDIQPNRYVFNIHGIDLLSIMFCYVL